VKKVYFFDDLQQNVVLWREHERGKRIVLFVLSWHYFVKKMQKESDGDHGGRFLRKNDKYKYVITW
jgi:hypothetical protein